jgi:hypothetical protein
MPVAVTKPAARPSDSAGRISQRAGRVNAAATSTIPAPITSAAPTTPLPVPAAHAPPRAIAQQMINRAMPSAARFRIAPGDPAGRSPDAIHHTSTPTTTRKATGKRIHPMTVPMAATIANASRASTITPITPTACPRPSERIGAVPPGSGMSSSAAT